MGISECLRLEIRVEIKVNYRIKVRNGFEVRICLLSHLFTSKVLLKKTIIDPSQARFLKKYL